MERVAIYLRKSRADIESEAHGEPDTLAKHRRTLLQYAKDKSLNIVRIYEEVASGEKITTRPEMQALLNNVSEGQYQAVLVMDMDRLGRGNMQEQGLIIDTFRDADTKIITPRKVYDLRNEMDEEYSEFEAFFARKELKIITRRLQNGRARAAQDGQFLATYAPFGYVVIKQGNLRTLDIDPPSAEIIHLIFTMYKQERLGMHRLAKRLNELGFSEHGKTFYGWRVNQILRNVTYAGFIQWKRKKGELILSKGLHPAIIEESLFRDVQDIMQTRQITSAKKNTPLQNPLAGLIKCANCGRVMTRNTTNKEQRQNIVRCVTDCPTRGAKVEVVERELLHALTEYMERHKVLLRDNDAELDKKEKDRELRVWNQLKKEMSELTAQKNNLHDLLERGVYSIEMYLERSQVLAERIREREQKLMEHEEHMNRQDAVRNSRAQSMPVFLNVMELYPLTTTAEQKNILLKSVLHKVIYHRNKSDATFSLTIYPKLPL